MEVIKYVGYPYHLYSVKFSIPPVLGIRAILVQIRILILRSVPLTKWIQIRLLSSVILRM